MDAPIERSPLRYRSSGLADLGLPLGQPTPVFLKDGDRLDLLVRNEIWPMVGRIEDLPFYGLPQPVPLLEELERAAYSPTALWAGEDGAPREIWVFEIGLIHRFSVERGSTWRFTPVGTIGYPEIQASKGLGTAQLIHEPGQSFPHILIGGADWRQEVPVPEAWSPDLPFSDDMALRYGGDDNAESRLAKGCRAFDAPGWQVKAMEGFVYLVRNTGTKEPRYDGADLIGSDNKTIRVCGKASPVWFSPFTDGVPHLVIADFQGNLLDFRSKSIDKTVGQLGNLGNGRLIDDGRLTDGTSPIELPGCMPKMTCWDVTGNGYPDLVYILEDGYVYVSKNDGNRLAQPVRLQQERSVIKVGVLSVPAAIRNLKGSIDLYCGNASGEIMHLRNITTDAEPDFEPPVPIQAGGEAFRIIAGPDGSPQGPVEYKWGYVAPTAADWTGNGIMDLILGCINGSYWLIPGRETAEGLEWDEPRRITVDGKPFTGVWRVRPSIADWNGDGELEMLTLDERGRLALYKRAPSGAPEALMRLDYTYDEAGEPYEIGGINNFSSHTSIGRNKLLAYDWDGDGLLELLVGAHCQMKWPIDLSVLFKAPEGGRGSATMLLIDNIGTPDKPVFGDAYPVVLKDGTLLDFGAHSCAPVAVDWNDDGSETVVVGNEDGLLYVFDRNELMLLKEDVPRRRRAEFR